LLPDTIVGMSQRLGRRNSASVRPSSRPGWIASLSELRASRGLLVNLTLREIRGKYKRTALGQAWSLLNPVAQMATYSIVFSIVLRGNHPKPGNPSGVDVFALWLTCALLPWLFFQNVLNSGMGALISNANLIQKVYFPRAALVISSGLAFLFTFSIEMSVLTVALLAFGGSPLLCLPATIFFMLVLFAFGLGLSFLLAIGNVYFRDTQHFVSIAMQLWFYATPIIYPISVISGSHPQVVKYYRLNPIERFTEVFRNTMYDGRWPTLADSVYVIVWALVALALGYAVFTRYEGRLAEEL
jgi:ABC-2 type transport system permease protein